jgi:molybdopterin/thiamine biosynthesis adenylyltransferase
MIDRRLRERYSRQTRFPGIGEEGQAKLINSGVVVIGCGALGCNIAIFLARAGVGQIKIVDRDFIEYHNLQRQTLFDEDDIKARLPKAIAAAHHLRKANSAVEIEGIVADANFTNIERFCQGADVILDGLDNFETRFLINDVSLKHGIPWIYGAAIASTGMTMTIIPDKSPCLRCFYPSLPDSANIPTCETAGVVGTAPAVIGSLQATEAIKIIVGAETNHDVIMVDVWHGTFNQISMKRYENCPACHGKYDYLESAFELKTTVLCGQSRAVQVVNASLTKLDLHDLASKLKNVGSIDEDEYVLRFTTEKYEINVFPDGRAIVRNTLDESRAKELYDKYIMAKITDDQTSC